MPNTSSKHFSEMGVEIIHDPMDPLCRGLNLFEQMLDERDEVGRGVMACDRDGAAPALGSDGHKPIAGISANGLVIALHGRSGLERFGRARLSLRERWVRTTGRAASGYTPEAARGMVG